MRRTPNGMPPRLDQKSAARRPFSATWINEDPPIISSTSYWARWESQVVDNSPADRRWYEDRSTEEVDLLDGEKILVTGVTGKIAFPIARTLAAANEVWGVARLRDPRDSDN